MTFTLTKVLYASLIATASLAAVARGIETTGGRPADIASKTAEATVDVLGNVENELDYGIDGSNATSNSDSVRVSLLVESEDVEEDEEDDDEEEEMDEAVVDDEAYEEDEEAEEEDEDDDDEDWIYIDEEADGPGAKFGVAQILDHVEILGKDASIFNETAVLETLAATDAYMTEIRANPAFDVVRDTCYNVEPLCTGWAAHGECDENPDYMETVCAPACQTCDQLHYETRCPMDEKDLLEKNVWKAGDLNKLFESIVDSDLENEIHILSMPSDDEEIDGPWIIAIDDFFTAEEAAHIIQMGEAWGFERNKVSGGVDELTGEALENEESEDITSSSLWCTGDCDDDAVVDRIFEKLEEITKIPFAHTEQMQIVKYEEGQFYGSHTDFFEYEKDQMAGPRIMTALLYFNTVLDGGETYFEELDLGIQPKAGRVLLFANVLNEDPNEVDERVEHEALELEAGQKYIGNIWMHSRNVIEASEAGCYGIMAE